MHININRTFSRGFIMTTKDNLPTIKKNTSGLGAGITTTTRQPKAESSKKPRDLSRALTDLSSDEKQAIVSTLLAAITDLKADVDASNTLITALVPGTMTEEELEAAIASYEDLSKDDLNSYTRVLIVKFRS
jgi:hypothetical protein